MNTTSILAPTLQTILNIGFFKTQQTLPSEKLVATEWIRFNKRSEIGAIYHHLKIGRKLQLKKETQQVNDPRIQVWFNGHYLGRLLSPHTTSINELLVAGTKLETTISKIEKEKYLPIQNLQIKIKKA